MDALFSPTVSPTRFLAPGRDIYIHTSRGRPILAHATILASASPVLKEMVTSNNNVKLYGVPSDAVAAFVRFIYTSRCSEESMKNYGIHLLVLSHVFSVPQLKQRCVVELAQLMTTENVADVLHLASLCDAPDLYLKCVKFVINNFTVVRETEGWKFLREHDPRLKVDIIHLKKEQKLRKKRAKKQRKEQKLFVRLSKAMKCLEHICTEGCTNVAPYDVEFTRKPCTKFSMCQGLQGLIRHFIVCKRRIKERCISCKRMWQLFRLHSCICLQEDTCKVPLCREFQMKSKKENKKGDARWKLLVRKVASARAMSSLQLPKTKRDEEIQMPR